MATIELFPDKSVAPKEKQVNAFSFKPLLKRYAAPILLFFALCALFSFNLCKINLNRDHTYFERLEEILEEVQLSNQLTEEQQDYLDVIAKNREECTPSVDFIRSFDKPDADLFKRVENRVSILDVDLWSLKYAFTLLEQASEYRKQKKMSQAQDTLNNLKKTLDHKMFKADKQLTFKNYLKSLDIKI